MTCRIAIIGFGKIARDEHAPAIAAHPDFELVAVTAREDPGNGVRWFATVPELFDVMAGAIDAVAICTPPAVRAGYAHAAIDRDLAVLLEKPPAATLGAIDAVEAHARAHGTTLYATWHSQHAPAVAQAAQQLAGETVTRLHIAWREDVRRFHPGQEWIWAPGGFGVFDPGINALSIATRIVPQRLIVDQARLVYPGGRQSPIAATVRFGEGFDADFDFRADRPAAWTIEIATAAGRSLCLSDGGRQLAIDGVQRMTDGRNGYPAIYDQFATLIGSRSIEVDREPLRIVADAFLVGERVIGDAFDWTATHDPVAPVPR